MTRNRLFVAGAFIGVFMLHLFYSVNTHARVYKNWVQMQDVNFIFLYFQRLDFLMGLSCALAVAFTVYAIIQFIALNKNCLEGVVGGATLSGIIYFLGCFLVGCCGSPMLIVYAGLFGPAFLRFTKPLIFLFTALSVLIGVCWIKRKAKTGVVCQTGFKRCQIKR